jgi:hypothetical protein
MARPAHGESWRRFHWFHEITGQRFELRMPPPCTDSEARPAHGFQVRPPLPWPFASRLRKAL